MSIAWTLSIGGVTTTLAGWGVREPRVTFRSLDVDEFTFTVAGNIYDPPPFAYGATVQLNRDDTPWFIGTITRLAAIGDVRNELWQVVASNAWWQLGRTMFQQEMASYTPECVWLPNLKTTKVTLFQHALLGTSITTGQQIRDVLTYGASVGIPITTGTVPEFITLPFETTRDLTLADVIRRCLQPTPDAVSWCDYSTGVCVFNAQVRSLVSSVELDLESPVVVSLELEERRDLVPSGVRFNYLGVKECPLRVPPGCVDPATGEMNEGSSAATSARTGTVVTIKQDFAGTPDFPGGLIGTVDLAQLGENTSETAPIGLAGEYFASLLTPPWQGRVVTVERECTGALRPGKKLNIANGAAAWTSMDALIQEVTENLYAGETAATMGPPNHLGPQDFVSLIEFTRRRPLSRNAFAKTRHPGDEENPNCAAGKDPEAEKLEDELDGTGALDADKLADALTGANGPFREEEVETCDPPGGITTLIGRRPPPTP
jgi:hypothetical protein